MLLIKDNSIYLCNEHSGGSFSTGARSHSEIAYVAISLFGANGGRSSRVARFLFPCAKKVLKSPKMG